MFVGEDVVGGFGFFEFGLGFFAVVRVAVRVVFHRQFAERFFDVVLAGGFGNAEDVVEVFFCHLCVGDGKGRVADAALSGGFSNPSWGRGWVGDGIWVFTLPGIFYGSHTL